MCVNIHKGGVYQAVGWGGMFPGCDKNLKWFMRKYIQRHIAKTMDLLRVSTTFFLNSSGWNMALQTQVVQV